MVLFFLVFVLVLVLVLVLFRLPPGLSRASFGCFTCLRLKSYENTESTGTVQVMGIESLDILKGRNVLVVEV
jgi:hypothetical protein